MDGEKKWDRGSDEALEAFEIRNPRSEGRRKAEVRNPNLGGQNQIEVIAKNARISNREIREIRES